MDRHAVVMGNRCRVCAGTENEPANISEGLKAALPTKIT